jgi:hypothetical protein
MKNQEIFIIVVILLLVILYAVKMYEPYLNNGIPTNDDISQKITTIMDYDGARESTVPTYPNNLVY